VVSRPPSRRRSPIIFISAPQTRGLTTTLTPRGPTQGKNSFGATHAEKPPHAAPTSIHPMHARGNEVSLRRPRACTRLSKPSSKSTSKIVWRTISARTSMMISIATPHALQAECLGSAAAATSWNGRFAAVRCSQ